MYLLRCPQCKGHTPADDDADRVRCQWCHLWVGTTEEWNVCCDPAMVRQFVLKDLSSLADLMYTFGVGQTVIAGVYFFFFLGCGGLIRHFHGQLNEIMIIAIGVVFLIGGMFIIAGSRAVRRGQGRLYAVVGAIFTLTSPLVVGLPIGIWALRKLNRPEAREVFGTRGE